MMRIAEILSVKQVGSMVMAGKLVARKNKGVLNNTENSC
jgi:hypothetical protein